MRIWVIGRRESARMLALIGVILAVLFLGGNFFRGVQATAASKRQLPIYSVEREGKTISLGINCAWDNADIPQLLDILDKAGVKATFFVVGQWCDKYPESVKAIGDAGHEIGNHSDRHKDMTKLDRAGIVEEIENASDKVEKITGTRPKLFRAPSGAYNDLLVETARGLGYEVIQWDCDSIDWKGYTADEICNKVEKKAGPGSITLFHSGAKASGRSLAASHRIPERGGVYHPAGVRNDLFGTTTKWMSREGHAPSQRRRIRGKPPPSNRKRGEIS